jgi:hypothetical protein
VRARLLTPRARRSFCTSRSRFAAGVGAEFKPVRFDAVNSKGVFEIAERPGAMNSVQQIVANLSGLNGKREILHDGPLVDVEL